MPAEPEAAVLGHVRPLLAALAGTDRNVGVFKVLGVVVLGFLLISSLDIKQIFPATIKSFKIEFNR